MRKIIFSIMFLTAFILMTIVAPIETWGAWSNNPAVNTAISVGSDDKDLPQIASDGQGGAIITWEAYSYSGLNYNIYAQRIGADGNVKWTANGVAICTAVHNQRYPQIVSDGSGGAIITWQDERRDSGNSDIYAQRIDADGNVKWTGDGVAISAATGLKTQPKIVSDGSGGAIITWTDARNFASNGVDIYAQRIDASGTVKWQTDGVPICTAVNGQINPQIVTDGAGGAIITWQDQRSGHYDIYAQRIDNSGGIPAAWLADGLKLTGPSSSNQTNPTIIADTVGAIITWQDDRSGGPSIYAQKIDINGTLLWPATDGVAVYSVANGTYPTVADDGDGGAIITWMNTFTSDYKIYAQRIDKDGNPWTYELAIGTASGNLPDHPLQIAGDGSGSAIIVWQYLNDNNDLDIYAQKIASNGAFGAILWTPTGNGAGVAISTAAGNQLSPQIMSDGSGGAIITWQDTRSGTYDIYAQKVMSNGTLSPLLYADFASFGLYQWNGAAWTLINGNHPAGMVASGSNLYADFASFGLYQWNGATWTLINGSHPTSMVASGSNLYADFAGFGLYQWNGAAWTLINGNHPARMVASGANLYADFTGFGIYQWNGATWTLLNGNDAASMVASGSNLYADFASFGLYQWNGATWALINGSHPASMVASGSSLIADFASYGLYQWNGATWTLINGNHPANVLALGPSLYYADFASYGLYQWNGATWALLNGNHAANMVASGSNLYADFASYGLYQWNGATWTLINGSHPASMVAD